MSHLQRWKLKTQKLCRSPSNVFCNSSTWDIRRAFSSCSSGLISCSRLCAPELLSFVYELGSESIERPVFICSESSSMITAIYRTRWNVLFYLHLQPIVVRQDVHTSVVDVMHVVLIIVDSLNLRFHHWFQLTLRIVISQWNVVILNRHDWSSFLFIFLM